MLLTDVDHAQAEAAAARINAALAPPFALADLMIAVDASIGIVMVPDHGRDVSSLMRCADTAMYRAKGERRKRHVYTPSDDRHGDERLRTVQQLRTGLLSEQLRLHYQPKLDLRHTARSAASKALVRWDHPERGLLYPDASSHSSRRAA